MKRTLQFERTDRDITEAFLRILPQKPFEKITVQDIITEAMVNRSTFYQHFPDKYAILEKLQKKYVTELTDLVENVLMSDRTDLKQIDRIMGAYFLKNRRILRILLHIRTGYVDIGTQLRALFTEYFRKSSDQLTDLEAHLISGLWLDFFTYYLEHDAESENYSSLLFSSFYKISLHFFQMEQSPDAQRAFIELLDTYAGK